MDFDFEDFIGDMVNSFVRVRAEHIDEEIDHWLEKIGVALSLDRANIGEYERSSGTIQATHCWARPGVRPVPRGIDPAHFLPELTRRTLAGETVVFSTRDSLPPVLLEEINNSSLAQGVKSNVTMPLKIGGTIIGGVTFDSMLRERKWSPRLVKRLALIAEVFGSALERKREIEEIRRLQTELFEVSGRSIMGELTASLAHELNQPLGAILNNAEAVLTLLDTKPADLVEAKAALEDIVHDDRRAADIIHHVRTLLRRGETQPSLLDPEEILLDVERILKHDAVMKKISFRVEVERQLPAITGHKTQLTQALVNLVLNAFDAVTENVAEQRVVRVTAAAHESGHLSISVQDSGPGIDPRTVPQLFRAFFTTKAKGMGMGLAIVRSVVEGHGGEIRVTPNADRGTTFEIILPASPRS